MKKDFIEKIVGDNKPTFSDEFISIMNEIDKIVAEDFIGRQEEVCKMLECLATNNLALRYFFNNSLQQASQRELISAQSFLLFKGSNFLARLNLWYPENHTVRSFDREGLDFYFSFGDNHNHNFNFFTVGILGSGYFTKFMITNEPPTWEFDQRINFIDEYEFTLSKGMALFIPQDTHFHTQLKPKEFSVSLNILPTENTKTKQFAIDNKTKRVCNIVHLKK